MNPEEQGVSDGYYKEAAELLEKTYRRFYTGKKSSLFLEDYDTLYNNIHPMEGHLFLESVKLHIVDFSTDRGVDNKGDWFPSAAAIQKHALVVQDRIKSQKKEFEIDTKESSVSIGDALTLVEITDERLRKIIGKDFIECIPMSDAQCTYCGDSGYVRFYYHPPTPGHVFLGNEWLRLWDKSQDQAEMFRCASCLCDECEKGKEIIAASQNNNPRYKPPTLFHIRKLVERRKKKKQEMIRQKDLAAGETLNLLTDG